MRYGTASLAIVFPKSDGARRCNAAIAAQNDGRGGVLLGLRCSVPLPGPNLMPTLDARFCLFLFLAVPLLGQPALWEGETSLGRE